MTQFTNIVAVDRNGLMGKEGDLPWKIPAEMKEFRQRVAGQILIMGRKTCESLPKKMSDKENYVISRNPNFKKEGYITVSSVEEVINILKDRISGVFVIGGSSIYEEFLKINESNPDISVVNEITFIDIEAEGDTYFPLRFLDNHNYKSINLYSSGDGKYNWTKKVFFKN